MNLQRERALRMKFAHSQYVMVRHSQLRCDIWKRPGRPDILNRLARQTMENSSGCLVYPETRQNIHVDIGNCLRNELL